MRVYLAGERDYGPWAKYCRRRLFSYYYHSRNNEISEQIKVTHENGITDLFLDSGAFSAWSQDAELDIDKYAEYINKYGHYFTCISSLDDTSKNEQKSWDNQMALESNGCKVQPVFHAREDPSWLGRYLDRGYDYIFLGGLVPESTPWLIEWLDSIWSNWLTNPDGTARVKVHGFGLTDRKVMFRYPWFSVDSSSWIQKGMYGALLFRFGDSFKQVDFTDDSPHRRSVKSHHYYNLPDAYKRIVDTWLKQHELTADMLAQHYSWRDIANVAVYQEMEHLGIDRFVKQQDRLFSI